MWRNGNGTGRVSAVVRSALGGVAPAFERHQRSPCAGVCQRVDGAEHLVMQLLEHRREIGPLLGDECAALRRELQQRPGAARSPTMLPCEGVTPSSGEALPWHTRSIIR